MSKKFQEDQKPPIEEPKAPSTASTIIAESASTDESPEPSASRTNRFSFLPEKKRSLSDLFDEKAGTKNCCIIL